MPLWDPMRRPPLLLRGHGDPLDSVVPVVERYEKLAAKALEKYQQSSGNHQHPVVIIGAATLDSLLDQPEGVDLIGDLDLAEAAERSGVSDFSFGTAEAEELRGALTALRGAAGEQWVLDGLNSGSLSGPAGTTSAQLLGFTQPGSDLAFTDIDGNLIAQANVKIAQSARVIQEHFDRHPDVPIIYASSDAAQDAQRLGFQVIPGGDIPDSVEQVVIDIGRTSEAFDQEIAAGLGIGDWAADQASALDLLDAVPWFSTAAIAVRAIQRLRAGASRAEVLRESGRDATVAAAGIASGKIAASATSSEPSIAVIALLASSLTYAATEVRRDWRQTSTGLGVAADFAERLTGLRATTSPKPKTHGFR